MKVLVIRTVDLEVYPLRRNVRRTGPLACSLLNMFSERQTTSYDKDGTVQKRLLVVVQFLVIVIF